MNHRPELTPNVAVFCDFENVAIGVRDANYDTFNINMVLERILDKGKIVVKKAYADWDRYKAAKRPLHEAAFELIEIPHLSYSGKNSADIRLVVDALDLCYTKSHVHVFVIISGDSDFSPLVSKLRENNKTVIGLGVKNSSSDLLIDNCDEFIYYDDLVRIRMSSQRKSSGRPVPVARAEARAEAREGEAPPERRTGREPAARRQDGRSGAGSRSGRDGRPAAGRPDGGGRAVPVARADAESGGNGEARLVPERGAVETRQAEARANETRQALEARLAAEAKMTPEQRQALEDRLAAEVRSSAGTREGAEAGRQAPLFGAHEARRGGETAEAGLEATVDQEADAAAESGLGSGPIDADQLIESVEPAAPPAESGEVAEKPTKGRRSRGGSRSSRGKRGAAAAAPVEEAAPEPVPPAAAPVEAGVEPEPAPVEPATEPAAEAEGAGEAPAPPSRNQPRSRSGRKPAETLGDKQEALKLVLETAITLLQDTDSDLWGSMVKQVLKRKRPHFLESYYGYRSFNELLVDAERQGLLEIVKDVRSGGYRIVALGPNA